jgi:hypothetical protein
MLGNLPAMRSADPRLLPAAAIALAALLAGCQSQGSAGSPSAAAVDLGGTTTVSSSTGKPISQDQANFEAYLNQGYCPPVQVRTGTEALVIFEKGHEDDQNYVRYQASLTKLARECHYAGSALMIKVGIAGRLTAGPTGKAGNFALPLRVAVVKQDGGNVFYSDVTKVPVTIAPPEFAADYSTVVDNISFEVGPQDRDLIIYVGYDEGRPKSKAGTPTG